MKKKDKKTTYEMCRSIRKIIADEAAEGYVYARNRDSSYNPVAAVIKNLNDTESTPYLNIDPTDLYESELKELGFGNWDGKIWLIPIWLYPFLKGAIKATCIDGKTKVMKVKDMDTDTRFGCLAYGVEPKHEIMRCKDL
jgi:hypothetical protein